MASCLQAARALVSAYNTWTLDEIMAIRASDCVNYILPASLDRKAMNNDEYVAFFAPRMPPFKNFNLTVHDTVVDEAPRKVVLHMTSTASTAIGEYRNEYMLKLHITEDRRKIDRFEEFVDSGYSAQFMTKLHQHLSGSTKASI
ncbi:MAG: hypothetical protein L6R40_004190 [Gallowayella cf. fulva]|nr:MAG: hypothetical protein L6R40_004190 [Xanthomendoza cf. fulva]